MLATSHPKGRPSHIDTHLLVCDLLPVNYSVITNFQLHFVFNEATVEGSMYKVGYYQQINIDLLYDLLINNYYYKLFITLRIRVFSHRHSAETAASIYQQKHQEHVP